MSRHDPTSDLGRLNRCAARRPVQVHPWTAEVLRAALVISGESGGAFDVTLAIGGSWRDIVLDDGNCISFRRPLTLDLGGIAKGFAVDCAVAALRQAGVRNGLVNAGGDLRAFGAESHLVRVRHPLEPGRGAVTLLLRERAMATSGIYFAPDLFDGRDGQPICEEVSVTVGASNCMMADALTKVALVLREGAGELLLRYEAEAFLLDGKHPARWLSHNNDAEQRDQA
jgi:thiamine biosynthesis lipoprotein